MAETLSLLAVVFLGTTLLGLLLARWLAPARDPALQRRIAAVREARVRLRSERLLEGRERPAEGPEEAEGQGPRRAARGRLWERADRRLAGGQLVRDLQRELRRAGLQLRASEFLAASGAAGLLAGLAGQLAGGPLAALLLAATGCALPRLYVLRRVRERQRQFAAQLPEALGLLANSLKSGYSLLQAIDVAASDLPQPVAGELAQVVRETRVNIALEDALANLLGRMPSRDLDMVVTAVLIQRQVGGNLAEVLEQIAETIRERVRLQGEIRALTAQGRMSGLIVGLLPVGLAGIILLINPSYIRPLFHTAAGLAMLGGAALLELVGALLIRRLVRLDA